MVNVSFPLLSPSSPPPSLYFQCPSLFLVCIVFCLLSHLLLTSYVMLFLPFLILYSVLFFLFFLFSLLHPSPSSFSSSFNFTVPYVMLFFSSSVLYYSLSFPSPPFFFLLLLQCSSTSSNFNVPCNSFLFPIPVILYYSLPFLLPYLLYV